MNKKTLFEYKCTKQILRDLNKTLLNARNICTQCHVNSLARTESFWVFSPGFSSLINNSQSSQTSFYISSKSRIVCPSNQTSIGHGLPSVFQLQNIYARQCVGASVGLYTRHNLCRTDHIEICRPRTDCWLSAASSLSGEDFTDLFWLKDGLYLYSNFCAQILHFSFYWVGWLLIFKR